MASSAVSSCVTSCRLAPVTTSDNGTPRPSTSKCRLLLFFSRSAVLAPTLCCAGGAFINRLRTARDIRTARHIYTNFRLKIQGENTATGTTIMLLFAKDGPPPHSPDPLKVSDFEDVYVRDAVGIWKYKSRTIRPLFRNPDKQSIIPLGVASKQ